MFAHESRRARVVVHNGGDSTGVGLNSICLPRVFTTAVLTIGFSYTPSIRVAKVWKPHFPIESKYGVLAPRSAIKIQ
jgi:hypothetical protein